MTGFHPHNFSTSKYSLHIHHRYAPYIHHTTHDKMQLPSCHLSPWMRCPSANSARLIEASQTVFILLLQVYMDLLATGQTVILEKIMLFCSFPNLTPDFKQSDYAKIQPEGRALIKELCQSRGKTFQHCTMHWHSPQSMEASTRGGSAVAQL